ncbi:DRMBL-domain-containing protein [Exidia glandulosa HHB12029]|uniref:DRMBL-domain-containing protein n=1 Tax=Exidia glandulosa HHB12029 TaxID=1314781 RepID=A0A165KJ04_EXIGL|nr:DRMBL-domain-containing protein [Exidia glandulosa HHB12029]
MRDDSAASGSSTSSATAHPQLADLSSAFDDTEMPDSDNVWALEDDELFTFAADDEDVDVDMDLDAVVLVDEQEPPGDCTPVPPPKEDPEECCPLCSSSLLELSQDDIQAHVNSCLDKLQPRNTNPSASSSSSKPSTPVDISKAKPLRPISQLRVPPAPSGSGGGGKRSNAFSMLMSGHKENEAWKEATEAEESSFKGGRRKAPFYKVMTGMPIAVDAFRYGKIPGITAYFLTHAHSDHYTNLSSSWKHGPIYCSETTGNLIVHLLGVDRKWVHPLPQDIPTVIPDTGGVEVTVIEANHCPGSSLFLFTGKQTVNAGDSTIKSSGVGTGKVYRYLHCGDFRASPAHVLHPAIKGKKLDLVYLDTTYLNAKVIEACAELAKQIVDGAATENGGSGVQGSMDLWCKSTKGKEKACDDDSSGARAVKDKSKLLVVVGTYSIGKERIVKAIAKILNAKVFCDARKRAILQCQADPELHAMLSSDARNSRVHVVPLQHISIERMEEYLEKMAGAFDRVLAFRPTGWTYVHKPLYTPPAGTDLSPAIGTVLARDQARHFTASSLKPSRGSSARIMLYGVPYSEHSSFFELTAFALSCDWVKMIATVNVGNVTTRGKMAKWFEKWQAERRARAIKGDKGVVKHRAADYW